MNIYDPKLTVKLIIAGSRTIKLPSNFIAGCIQYFNLQLIDEVCSGKEPNGVDAAGEKFALCNASTVVPFYPDWEKYGKSAGPRRNREMAKYADALLLIWDGESRGSSNMRQEMMTLGKPVYEVIIKQSGVKGEASGSKRSKASR